jgi:putative intracellular protease/amidase
MPVFTTLEGVTMNHLARWSAATGAVLCSTLGFAIAPAPTHAANVGAAAPAVLLIVSGEGREEGGKLVRPGYEMDELSQAWLVLRANGLRVEIASPQGGAVVADRHNPKDDHVAAFLADDAGRAALASTRSLASVKPGEHAALFIMGGKGAMFDLPRDGALLALLQRHQGLLAAVCHGPAALVAAKDSAGRPLVQGKRMTGFTDEEEQVFGKTWAQQYPFWIERQARSLGAVWDEAPLMMPKMVQDGRLITGQNPFSTTLVAEAIVKALGRTPVARTPFIEENTMQHELVQAAMRAEPQRVKAPLVAMLGYYQFDAAPDNAGRAQALAVMQMAEPHFQHPQFRIQLARAYAQQAQRERAREVIQATLAQGVKDAALRTQAEQLAATL